MALSKSVDTTQAVVEPAPVVSVADVAAAVSGRIWEDRFAQLASLEDGWLHADFSDDRSGFAITGNALMAAHQVLDRVEAKGGAVPGIFPLEEGGVMLEWANPGWVSNIEITGGAEEDCPEAELEVSLFDLMIGQNRGVITDSPTGEQVAEFLDRISTRDLV